MPSVTLLRALNEAQLPSLMGRMIDAAGIID